MSHQKLTHKQIMYNVRIEREIKRLQDILKTRKVDDADNVYITRLIAKLKTYMY